MTSHTEKENTMFKLSLPVQRFVVGCIMLMILIIGLDVLCNAFWSWQDTALDMIYHLQ
jgi:hypothetical protein